MINEKAEGNGKRSACVRDREKKKGGEESKEERWKQMEEEVCVCEREGGDERKREMCKGVTRKIKTKNEKGSVCVCA